MKGLIALSTLTRSVMMSAASLISCSVVNLLGVRPVYPIPNLIEVWASSGPSPIARNTYEGSRDALVQADPELTAMFLIAIIMLSPSTYSKE